MKSIKKITTALAVAALCITSIPATVTKADTFSVNNFGFENGSALSLEKIGAHVTGFSNLDGGVAEIISYDSKSNKAFVVNGATGMLDILDMSLVTKGYSKEMSATSLDMKAIVTTADSDFAYGDMTSVSVNSEKGIIAVALQDAAYDKNGKAAILNIDGELLALLPAGCQPDMITFTPDGSKILVANEGEPRKGFGETVVDPAGSTTVIAVNYEDLTASTSITVGFEAFDEKRDELLANNILMVKGHLPSTDFEPEYITCDNETAYIALQEANAIAVLNLTTNTYDGVYSLGYKDLSLEKNAVDLIEDNEYAAKTYADTLGAYMPDGVSLYATNDCTYLLTANEGDAREWGADDTEYVNEIKVTLESTDGTTAKKVRSIDPAVTDGLPENKTVLFGGRSFSIYQITEDGLTQVYDSGNDFESKTAAYFPEYFNCSNDDNEYDSRSPKKGPEPESVTIGAVDGKTYAFVALERIGGIMVYDITDPTQVAYVNYINTRDFSEDPENADPEENPDFYLKGDVAPEGLYFVGSESSPSKTPILLAAFEVSGTVAAYSVGEKPAQSAVVYGDVDNDNDVAADDALAILKAVVKLGSLNDYQLVVAEVDGNQEISADDALLVLQKVVKLIDAFPVENTQAQ